MRLNTGSLNPGGFQVRIEGRERGRVARSTAEDRGEDMHRGEPRQHQLVGERGSRRGPSSRGSAAGSTHRRKRIKERTFIQRISDRINSSTEEDQGEDRHPEDKLQDKFIMEEDQGEELHPEDQRQDQLIDGRGSRSGPSSAEDP